MKKGIGMKILSEWKGSTDPEIKSGTAVFRMLGTSHVMELASFGDFHTINNLCKHYQSAGFESAQTIAIQQLKNMREMK